jgi:hypothetical protein
MAEVSGDVTVFRTLLTTSWPEVEREWESLKEVVVWRNERREGDFCDGCEEGEEVIMGEEKMALVEEEAMAMGDLLSGSFAFQFFRSVSVLSVCVCVCSYKRIGLSIWDNLFGSYK